MRRNVKKALSFILATAMAFAVLSGARNGGTGGMGQVEAANTDKFGFDTSIPSTFDANDGKNPYGSGVQTFNTKSEAFIWRQSGSNLNASTFNYAKKDKLTETEIGKVDDNKHRISTSLSGKSGQYRYVSTKGYDPYGTGHDNMVAMVGCDYGKESRLVVARYNGNGTGSTSTYFSLKNNSKEEADWLGSVPQWAYKNYFTLTTGDFDGDGKDEIAVYVPQGGTPHISILDGVSLKEKSTIPLQDFMGKTGAELSSKMKVDDDTARCTIQISMDVADINRDGEEDLLIVGSYADIVKNASGKELENRSSVFACYLGKKGGIETSYFTKGTLDQSVTGYYFRTAAVSAGDIDFDGFPEVVIAGNISSSNKPDLKGESIDGLDGSSYAITTYAFDTNTNELNLGSTSKVSMKAFTKDGFYKDDNIHTIPALTCAAVNGMNEAEQVFLSGTFYKYEQGQWKEDYTAPFAGEADNGIRGYIISNTWIDQCVAGNFDENDLGIEQVLYTAGYKQSLAGYYFYRVKFSGKNTKVENDITTANEWYSNEKENEFAVYHCGKGSKPGLAIATVDVDNDTDTFEYTQKEYTYSNVQVAAILQAAPYFEDLKDNYDSLGSTSFGIVKGNSTSQSQTITASVGGYATFAIGSDALKFSTEASYTHGWEWEYEKELSQEFEFGFTAAEENSVVLRRTPIILYHYTVHPADTTKEPYDMTVGIQEKPLYTVKTVEYFNQMVEDDPALKDRVIADSVISNVEGRPDTYPVSEAGLRNFVCGNDFVEISNVGTNAATTYDIAINDQNSDSKSQSYSNEFELKIGLAGEFDGKVVHMDYSVGASGGGGWGGGTTVVNYQGINKTGSVAFPPQTETEYGFKTKMGTWSAKVGSSDVPVIGYVVKDIKMPPSPPRNLAVDTVTDHSIKIAWEMGSKKADTFEIYQVFDDGITNNPYSLQDTVPGDVTSYTFEGLDPATTYSYAVRAKSKENQKTLISEYTNTVTATTLSKGDAPLVARITKEQNVVVGDDATFTVEASPSSGVSSGLSYSWQMKKHDSSNWTKLDRNSTDLSYTIENVTKNMDGDQFRCVVSEIHNGVRKYCYSDNGILHVGKADTVSTVTALNDSDGLNSGYADETNQIPENTTIKENKVVKIKVGEKENSYEVYENDHQNTKATIPYIYRGVDDGKLYILGNVNEAAGTADSATEVVHKERYVTVDGDELAFDDFEIQTEIIQSGETERQVKTVDGNNYWIYAMHIFEPEVENSTETLKIIKSYYIYELIDITHDSETNTDIESATGEFYTLKTENNTETMEKVQIESDPDGEYSSADKTVTLGNAVQVEKTYTTYRDEVTSGDKVTITLKVTKKSNIAQFGKNASINILNTNTGVLKLIAATVDNDGNASVTWIPDTEGKYTITADYSGSDNTKTSSATTTYYAKARQEKNLYVVKANDTIYGGNINLESFKCTKNAADNNIVETELPSGIGVSYTVSYSDDSGKIVSKDLGNNNIYTPDIAGNHIFIAKFSDGTNTEYARTTVNVNKRPIVVAAPTKSGISIENTQAKKLNIEDIAISYKNDTSEKAIIDKDSSTYDPEKLFSFSSAPVLDENSGEGTYNIYVGFKDSESDLTKSFQNRYSTLFKNGSCTVLSDVFEVFYDSSINGKLSAYMGSQQVEIPSGYSVDKGTVIRFNAFPDKGYSVTEWKLTDSQGNEFVAGTDYEMIGDKLIFNSVDKNIYAHVEFGMNSHQVSFAPGANGKLEAYYLNAGQKTTKFDSPEPIPEGKNIIFTAIPDKGYVVKSWSISENGGTATILKNKDGSNYSKDSYEVTVKNDMYVTVEFEKEAYYSVDAQFESDESIVNCSFTYEGLGSDGKTKKGSSVKIKAHIPDVVIVKEWRLYKDGGSGYTVVQGGLDTFTIENVQKDMHIGVVLSGYKTNNLVFKAIDDSGNEIADVITAKCQDKKLISGKDYVAYIPVTFTAKLPKGYSAVKWTVMDVANNTETVVAKGRDALSYELPSLDKITQVILYIDKTSELVARNVETVFKGQPIDVADSGFGMFGSDEKLGKPVYKLENGGTGAGTLTGSKLTVTKVGTFVISFAIVDDAGKEVKAPVKATLTVKKGVGTGNVKASDIYLGDALKISAESSTNGNGAVTYTYKKDTDGAFTAQAPSKVGKYTVKATFAANDLYEGFEVTDDFEIKKKEQSKPDDEKQKNKNNVSINAGAKFTVKKSSAVLKWGKVKGADGYEIYGGECAPKKKLLVTVKPGKTTYTFKKIAGKKVNGRKMYRMVVKAYKKVNGKKVYIAESLDLHSVGPENPKFTNVKSITVKQTTYTLNVGKTAKIKASRTKEAGKKEYLEKWHASTYRYISSDEDIAKVSKKGVITAKKKGTCYIYVIGVNGVQKKVKVAVK